MSLFVCNFCNKQLSSKAYLTKHIQGCKKKETIEVKNNLEYQLKEQREKFEIQLQILQTQYETQIYSLETQLQSLRAQLSNEQDKSEKYHEQILEIAKQPKTTVTHNTTQNHNNRNTAIINQLAPYDLTKEQITQLFYQHFKLDTFHGGPDEIAKLTAQVILTNPETQKPKIACTDVSRKNFKYVDEEQEVQVDPGFQKTHDLIKGPLSQANIRVYVDELNKDDQYRDQWKKNDEFISDRTGFSDKLVRWMV